MFIYYNYKKKGCCSLLVEHITLSDNLTVEFDFLGKDSMRYHNEV